MAASSANFSHRQSVPLKLARSGYSEKVFFGNPLAAVGLVAGVTIRTKIFSSLVG